MTTTLTHKTGMIAALAAAGVLVMAAGAASAATGQSATTEHSVLVFDQAIKDGKVNVSYAYLPKNGYIVIYGAGPDGKRSGEPLGSAELKSGDHRDVAVKLTTMPAPGSKLWASLYEDRDGKAGFMKGADVSLWSDGKLPAENAFTVR